MSDITKRLRAYSEGSYLTEKQAIEAADEIERLQGEANSWKAEAHSMYILLFDKDAEIERLRAALREISSLGDVSADEAGMIAKRVLEQLRTEE
jgi:hypothetical protein